MEKRDESGHKPVLVIEDDPEIRKLLQTLLEKRGYPVRTAAHGALALESLAHPPLPGVILLDLYLPVMDGWEFREKQLSDPLLSRIPVIVITAAADALIEPVEAEQVIKKPLDVERLVHLVSAYCA